MPVSLRLQLQSEERCDGKIIKLLFSFSKEIFSVRDLNTITRRVGLSMKSMMWFAKVDNKYVHVQNARFDFNFHANLINFKKL